MRYELNHQDSSGVIYSGSGDIPLQAFIKHLAFAGFGGFPGPWSLYQFIGVCRYLGFAFEFQQYWLNDPICFEIPQPFGDDPTERAYVSNRIGRAFSDYFAKKIYGAIFTYSYEAAMVLSKHPIIGKRPDFYCDTLSNQFAIEYKGFGRKSVSEKDMEKYKDQSATGPLKVNFSVASVSYNLYSSPKINFYDPVSENVEYNATLNLKLRRNYYQSVREIVTLLRLSAERDIDPNYYAFELPVLLGHRHPIQLLLHRDILNRELDTNEWLPHYFENTSQHEIDDNRYIDVDGIGILIK
jgi:hypothetical protein